MFTPKHTIRDVLKEIYNGLNNGTIVLENRPSDIEDAKPLKRLFIVRTLYFITTKCKDIFSYRPTLCYVAAGLVVALVMHVAIFKKTPLTIVNLEIYSESLTRGVDRYLRVSEYVTLKPDDIIRIKFSVDKEAFVSIYLVDNQNNIFKLFSGAVRANIQEVRPEKGGFTVGSEPGQKIIYLFASIKPIEGIDTKIRDLQHLSLEKVKKSCPELTIQSFNIIVE